MASPTHVGSVGDSADNGQQSLTMTLPSHATDDFAMCFATADHSGTSPAIALTVATGWTELFNEIETDARDRRTACFYKKFTSASETDPVMTYNANCDHSAAVHVFRGVDTTTAFDASYTQGITASTITPTNEDIVTVTANACVVLFHHATYNQEITTPGEVSGYTLGQAVQPGTHAGLFICYDLDAGAPATIDPGAWTHAGTWSTSDSSLYTFALRPVTVSSLPSYRGANRGIARGVMRGVG